jgi:transposase
MLCRRARDRRSGWRSAQAGRRRAWTAEQKAAIVAGSVEDGALVSHVSRRHGLTPQQLFAWRRQSAALFGSLITSASPDHWFY